MKINANHFGSPIILGKYMTLFSNEILFSRAILTILRFIIQSIRVEVLAKHYQKLKIKLIPTISCGLVANI